MVKVYSDIINDAEKTMPGDAKAAGMAVNLDLQLFR